jgi:hypothetical protein
MQIDYPRLQRQMGLNNEQMDAWIRANMGTFADGTHEMQDPVTVAGDGFGWGEDPNRTVDATAYDRLGSGGGGGSGGAVGTGGAGAGGTGSGGGGLFGGGSGQ